MKHKMKLGERRAFINLTCLFASKVGGAIATIFFLPLFFQILGPDQFGVVAVILSLQALVMMLDLGMSTMVGRSIASYGGGSTKLVTPWHDAEAVLTVFYIGIATLAVIWQIIYPFDGLSITSIFFVVGIFWALVLQNLSLSVLLGAKSFVAASVIQLVGTIARGAFSIVAMEQIGATLSVFIATQFIISLLQMLVARLICTNLLSELLDSNNKITIKFSRCLNLLREGKSLLLFGVAGAAVMQLDKPIIASFFSVNEVSAYFLAATFCMTPNAVLAGPISQYFQPHIISHMEQGRYGEIQTLISRFTFTLVLVTVASSGILWLYSDIWLGLWLGVNSSNFAIAEYISILLPGVAIGMMGYIPYVLLISKQDYHFQSILSALMTTITLISVIYAAKHNNIYAICWIYSSYHIFSTLFSWARAIFLMKTRAFGAYSLIFSLKLTLLLVLIMGSLYFLISFMFSANIQAFILTLAIAIISLIASLFYFGKRKI